MSERPDTPQRLVRACAYLGVIGAVLMMNPLVVLTTWYSDSSQEQVERFTDPLVKDGVARGDAEMFYRIYLAIVATVAASVVIFAIYTAMGHAVSRIMLTAAVPVMAILGLTTDRFVLVLVSCLAVFFVFQVWHAEVNRWFARINGKEEPAPAAAADWPPPLPPAPAEQAQHPEAEAQQQWVPHPHAYAPPRPKAPTDVVKVWSLIALIGASVVAVGCTVFLLIYEFAREELVRQQLDSGMNWMNLSEAEVRDSYHDLAVMSWVALPLCIVAIAVSAVLLVRRRRRS